MRVCVLKSSWYLNSQKGSTIRKELRVWKMSDNVEEGECQHFRVSWRDNTSHQRRAYQLNLFQSHLGMYIEKQGITSDYYVKLKSSWAELLAM